VSVCGPPKSGEKNITRRTKEKQLQGKGKIRQRKAKIKNRKEKWRKWARRGRMGK